MHLEATQCALFRRKLLAALASFVVRVVAPEPSAGRASAPPVVVTRRAPPSWSCSPQQITRRVLGLLDAVNRGQTARAVRYFSEPAFQWYSVTTPPGVRDDLSHARELGTLASYLEARHTAGETLTLDQLRVNDVRRLTELDGVAITPTRTAGVEVSLRRDATDMAASDPRNYHGKALVACGRPRILMWLIGADQARKPTPLYPPPARPAPDAVVACAYRAGKG